jgi:hypothetical protein
MLVAGIVVETASGAADRVAARLAAQGIAVAGRSGARLAAVCEAPTGEALEALADRLVSEDEEILGVFPSFVGDDGA